MRRLSPAAAFLVLALLPAACRKRPKAPKYGDALAAALTKISSPTAAGQQLSAAAEPLPGWATQPPRLTMSGSRRVALAVGISSAGNAALARSAAEAQARAAVGRFLEGKASTASVEMAVAGARVVQTYTAADGRVYVQVEAPAHR